MWQLWLREERPPITVKKTKKSNGFGPRKGAFCFIIELIPCGNQSCTLAFDPDTPLEIAMSYLYRDEYKKVSEPTEADFARGFEDATNDSKSIQPFLVGLAIGVLLRKKVRRK